MSKVKVYDMAEGLSIFSRKCALLVTIGGVESEVVEVYLGKGEHKSTYEADLPTVKVPAMNDNGFVLHESNAINRYIATKYVPELYPTDFQKRGKIDEALEYLRSTIEGSFGGFGAHKWFFPKIGREVPEEKLAALLTDAHAQLALFEKQYFQSETKFLVNDELSLADIHAFASLAHMAVESSGFDWSNHANAKKYYDGLKAHEKFANVDKVLAGFVETAK